MPLWSAGESLGRALDAAFTALLARAINHTNPVADYAAPTGLAHSGGESQAQTSIQADSAAHHALDGEDGSHVTEIARVGHASAQPAADLQQLDESATQTTHDSAVQTAGCSAEQVDDGSLQPAHDPAVGNAAVLAADDSLADEAAAERDAAEIAAVQPAVHAPATADASAPPGPVPDPGEQQAAQPQDYAADESSPGAWAGAAKPAGPLASAVSLDCPMADAASPANAAQQPAAATGEAGGLEEALAAVDAAVAAVEMTQVRLFKPEPYMSYQSHTMASGCSQHVQEWVPKLIRNIVVKGIGPHQALLWLCRGAGKKMPISLL